MKASRASCPARRSQWGFLLLLVLLILSGSEAFLNKKQPSGWTYSDRISALQAVAKSGGKLVETEELFMEKVLARDIPRPVLVFFSAPW
jgi:hypothetical protein